MSVRIKIFTSAKLKLIIFQIPQGCQSGTHWIINLDPLKIETTPLTTMRLKILGSSLFQGLAAGLLLPHSCLLVN